MNFKRWFLLTFLLISEQNLVKSRNVTQDTFSMSIASMETLIEVEGMLIESVTKFTAELEAKVVKLKNLYTKLHKENLKAAENPEKYLFNPLNGYSLIRRMFYDWPNIEVYMTALFGEAHLEVMGKFKPQMPTTTDMEEATHAIYRLQLAYGLNGSDIARGLLNVNQYEPNLNFIDQYFLGHYLYADAKHYHSVLWTELAIFSFADTEYNEIIDYKKEKIYLLYAQTLMKQNRPKDALIAIQHALDLKPQDARLLKVRNDLQLESSFPQGDAETNPIPEVPTWQLDCRGYSKNTSSLYYCLYNTTSSPYSFLAPFKMEILHLDPFLVVYHDVISDADGEELKAMSRPVLERATVFQNHNRIRTAKFTGFFDGSSNTISRISRRIADMTGLDVENSEALNVINYGLGGHYAEHYDFFNLSNPIKTIDDDGDRLVTVLIYLSDVQQGGATIFPRIKVAVAPRKGSAVVWYNLKNDVEPDRRTRHDACPVLIGSKWVGTKWIRSKDQMFRRPRYM